MENISGWWIVIGAVALVLIVAGLAIAMRRRSETRRLRARFGSEYDRIVSRSGSRRKGEAILRDRERRVEQLETRPLSPSEQSHYLTQWNDIQVRFVDTPQMAVFEADRLVTQVMRARGYPTEREEDRLDDVAVAYPRVVSNYREACRIAALQERGQATTEDQRRAMVLYRDLFDELLNGGGHHEEVRRAS